MNLQLPLSEDYDKDFVFWLTIRIRRELFSNIDSKQVDRFNMLFKDDSFDFYEVISTAASSLKCKQIKSGYVIYIDPIVRYGNTNITINQLAKLMNYGQFGIKGYNLFTKVFNKVKANIALYCEEYYSLFIL